jgi:hypothetical protein
LSARKSAVKAEINQPIAVVRKRAAVIFRGAVGVSLRSGGNIAGLWGSGNRVLSKRRILTGNSIPVREVHDNEFPIRAKGYRSGSVVEAASVVLVGANPGGTVGM